MFRHKAPPKENHRLPIASRANIPCPMIPRALFLTLLACAPVHADLAATFTTGNQSHTRTVRLPALLVEKGEPASSGVAPGPFTITWTSNLVLDARSRLYFSFEGEGKAVLTIDDEEVLSEEDELGTGKSDRLRLNAGETPIQITYTSKPDGSGRFRLFWEERSFPREPVPPTAFATGNETTGGIRPELSARGLIAEHHCTKCHAPEKPFGEGAMPELSHMGPDLTTIGSRVSESWLRQWLAQPHTLKPTTTMPALVDASTEAGRQQAADLAAYLSSLGAPPEQAQAAFPPDLVKRGGQLFHEFGCVACHTLPGTREPDLKNTREPLNNVAQKFLPGTLEPFLKNPQAHHPSIGMPNFQLSDEEANALAAYLTTSSNGKESAPVPLPEQGDPARGKELAKALSCATCHDGLEEAVATTTPSFEALAGSGAVGCLAPDDETRSPAPELNLGEDRERLVAYLKADAPAASLRRDTPAEFAERQFVSSRCYACHERDEEPSLLAALHVESKPLVAHIEGHDEKLDQSRPQLTYIGEMLNATYIEDMLDGSVEPEPRPWLEMRMPAFSLHAEALAEGLSRTHGIAPGGPDDTERDPELAETGRMIAGQTGLACVLCHGVNDMKPLAAFEVQGINFDQCHQRLRPEYFYRWMHNPSRLDPDTKMPRYTQEDGSALRPDILEGDAEKQFEALWHYLLAGPKMEKP